jgi:hypothetical protein
MRPRIQCVVNGRFQGVRHRTDPHDQQKLAGNTVLVVLM